ncbi:MAG: 50S ribosomal protein L20 [Marinimicrobia bacterium 46_47]|nr:MAG: 50S ribosomal protein L20 [Marinimicrobia bacterium 46_47]
MAKGYWGARSRQYRTAKEAVERGWLYAYRDRRRKKRDFRRLWITRINAAVRQYDMSYSVFIHKLQENNIKLNRKQLSEMAIREPQSFKKLVESLK